MCFPTAAAVWQAVRATKRCGSIALAVAALAWGASGVHAEEPKPQAKTTMPPVSERKLLDEPQLIPGLLARRAIEPKQVPNPHWRADACRACHGTAAPTPKNLALRDRDVNRLCNTCHETISNHSYIHPVAVAVGKEMAARMPASFRDALRRDGGQMTCSTCHDIPMQCLPKRAREKGLNPLFFRGGPFRARTDLCFRCHDARAYERLNPHDQLTDSGELREASCRVCHDDVPDRQKAKGIANVTFNVKDDLNLLCTGCHLTEPHPGGAVTFSSSPEGLNHLRVPSPFVQARLQQVRKGREVHVPLDPNNGKVFCGTCHNVHEKGVLDGAAGRGADSKQRLRQPDMCGLCHEK